MAHNELPSSGESQALIKSIIFHFPQYRVLVYRLCVTPYAIVPRSFSSHLEKHHRDIPPQTRERIAQAVAQVQPVAQTPEEVILPLPTSEPIAGLPKYQDGFR